jgi:hypothetical protein
MTTTTTGTKTKIEWGVRLTWPDGHTETTPLDNRAAAEASIRLTTYSHDNPASAELVVRQVTVTGWEQVYPS